MKTPPHLNPLLARIMPFFVIALMVILFIVGIFIFSYVLIFAVIVGFILFVVGFIRTKFFNHRKTSSIHEEFIVDVRRENNKASNEKSGRLIEHDENEK